MWRPSGRLRCLVFGHEYARAAEGSRVFLRCVECLKETPGWTVEVRPLVFLQPMPKRRLRRVPKPAA